jgi:hypothetical protein
MEDRDIDDDDIAGRIRVRPIYARGQPNSQFHITYLYK